jgi:hypothetical protein
MTNRWPEAWKWISVAILQDFMTSVADGKMLLLDRNRVRLHKPRENPAGRTFPGDKISTALRYCAEGKRDKQGNKRKRRPTMFLLEGLKIYPPTRAQRSIWVLIFSRSLDIKISTTNVGDYPRARLDTKRDWFLGLDPDLCAVMADYLDEERWKL